MPLSGRAHAALPAGFSAPTAGPAAPPVCATSGSLCRLSTPTASRPPPARESPEPQAPRGSGSRSPGPHFCGSLLGEGLGAGPAGLRAHWGRPRAVPIGPGARVLVDRDSNPRSGTLRRPSVHVGAPAGQQPGALSHREGEEPAGCPYSALGLAGAPSPVHLHCEGSSSVLSLGLCTGCVPCQDLPSLCPLLAHQTDATWAPLTEAPHDLVPPPCPLSHPHLG